MRAPAAERRARTRPAAPPASVRNERAPMMISDLSVRRPVFATVMSLLLFILGIGAVTRPQPARIPRRRPPGGEHRDALSRRLIGRGRVAHHADHRERDLGHRRRRAPELRRAATNARRSTWSSRWSAISTAPPTTCASGCRASRGACRWKPIRRRSPRSTAAPIPSSGSTSRARSAACSSSPTTWSVTSSTSSRRSRAWPTCA